MKTKNKFKIRHLFEQPPKTLYNQRDPDVDSIKVSNEPEKNVNFLKLFKYATIKDKILIFCAILCSVGCGLGDPLYAIFFGKIAGEMIFYAQSIENATNEEKLQLKDTLMSNITNFALINCLMGIVIFVLTFSSTVLLNYAAKNQIQRIRLLYFKSALYQDISWFDLHQTGDFASRIADDLNKIEDGIGEKISVFTHLQTTSIFSIILALIKGWELTLICLISLPLIIISIFVITLFTSKISKNESDAYASAGSVAEEVLTNIRTVLAFGRERHEIDRYNNNLKIAKDNNIQRSFSSGLGFGLIWFFIFSGYALSFWYGVHLLLTQINYPVNERVYDASTVITILLTIMNACISFGVSTIYIETFTVAKSAAIKVFSVINRTPLIKTDKSSIAINNLKGDIHFRNVFFNYPARANVQTLHGLSFHVRAGEKVALVGPSGCGKSTCIQLVQRFYDPIKGEILIDGKDIKEIDIKWLRNNIGVVNQEPILFATTIYENIQLGNPKAKRDEIEHAAIKANAHEFIISLRDGYQTQVGEKGIQLSTGQKQRIAIARALVGYPRIVLFDEATSALDSHAETLVQQALDTATDATIIVIAHRLSTIKNVDRIIVISNGIVKEEGKHDQLIKNEGIYYNLVTSQILPPVQSNLETPELINSPTRDSTIQLPEDLKEKNVGKTKWWSEIMRMSKPERFHVLIGGVASFLTGASRPLFAWLFGSLIGIYTFGVAGANLTMRLRSAMFKSILKQEIDWFDRKENGVGSLGVRLASEASLVQGATGQCFGTIMQSLSTFILATTLSLYLEYQLGLLALAFTPFILASTYFEKRLIENENKSRRKCLENSTKIAVEALSNIRTVASLGCEEKLFEFYQKALIPYRKTMQRNIFIRAITFSIARCLSYFAYASCIFYGGFLVINKQIQFENVFKVSQSLVLSSSSIANALAFTPNVQKGLAAAKHIFELITRQSPIKDGSIELNNGGDIEYSNVSFAYPSRPTLVLKDINFSIVEGKTIALVGPSGGGKSTISQLLLRFYTPNKGEILINKENINSFLLQHLRRYNRLVAQEPSLFNLTIRENIAYGENEKDVKLTRIIEVAKRANIHNFIKSLPLGYETKLGEKGMQLSGGQKQRIAIARALIGKPKVLIFDEATSSLDTENELIVQNALNEVRKTCTCITIAHRLNTIRDADLILVINNGQIHEIGSHDQLIQNKSLYYNLYRLQSFIN